MNDSYTGKLAGTITLQPNGQFYIKSNFDESLGSAESGLDCAGTYTMVNMYLHIFSHLFNFLTNLSKNNKHV